MQGLGNHGFRRRSTRLGISDKFFVLASDAIQMVVMEIASGQHRVLQLVVPSER